MFPTFRQGFLSIAVVLGLTLSSCSKPAGGSAQKAPAPKQPVEVSGVARRDMLEILSLVGSLAPNETAQIRAEISGQVRSVRFDEGQSVTKGQVLLQIDDSELRAQLAQTEARYNLAQLNLRRSENLTEARSLSQAEADRTRSDFAAAEAELQLLRVRLAKMEIRAPFDGIVGARSISPGDYVTAATSITTLDDLSRLKIDFQVPERFTTRVGNGSTFTVRARTPAGEARSEGVVYFISSVIERTTRSSQVKGYLKGEAGSLKPGMFANIDIILQVHQGVLTVPEGAILTTAAGPQVVAVRESGPDKIAEFVSVQLGLRETGIVEVASLKPGALQEGTIVVASGVGALILFPGAKLDPRPLRAEFRVGN